MLFVADVTSVFAPDEGHAALVGGVLPRLAAFLSAVRALGDIAAIGAGGHATSRRADQIRFAGTFFLSGGRGLAALVIRQSEVGLAVALSLRVRLSVGVLADH